MITTGEEQDIKRLQTMVEKIEPGQHAACICETSGPSVCELHAAVKHACDLFMQPCADDTLDGLQEAFAAAFEQHVGKGGDYIAAVQSLPEDIRVPARAWLAAVVDVYAGRAGALLPSLRLFRKKTKG